MSKASVVQVVYDGAASQCETSSIFLVVLHPSILSSLLALLLPPLLQLLVDHTKLTVLAACAIIAVFAMWFSRGSSTPPADPPADPAPAPSSKPALTAEEIRAQRAKKLEQQAQTSRSNAASSKSQSVITSAAPVTARPAPPRPENVSPPSASSKQLSSSVTSSSSVPSPPPAARPALRTSASTPLSASASSPLALFSSLPSSLQPTSASNAAIWQSELIQDVLQVTIDKQRAAQRGNVSRTFLAEAAKEALSASPSERVLSLDQLDSVLIERLSLPLSGHTCSLSYLISCYRRVSEILAVMRHIHSNLPAAFASSLPEPLFLTTASDVLLAVETCDQLLARIIAYCCMVLTDDDVRTANQQELVRLLFSDPLLSRTLPPYFLDYIAKLSEPEQLEDVFTPIIAMCAGMAPPIPVLAQLPVFEQAKQKLQALVTLSKYPPLATLITHHPQFLPAGSLTGRQYQMASLLGFFLSHLTAPNDPVWGDIRQKSQSAIEDDYARVRAEYGVYHGKLVDMLKALIKDADNRERVVQFFTQLFNTNASKRKSWFDPYTTASDALFYTCFVVLLKLAMPIAKKNDTGSVRLEYVIANDRRLNYDGMTRLIASSADVSEKRKQVTDVKYNFSTECFFLTHECLQLLQPLLRSYQQLQQKAAKRSHELRRLERGSESGEQLYRAVEEEMMMLLSQLTTLNAHLLDPALHIDAVTFLDYTANLLHHHMTSASVSTMVNYVPEALVECMIDYYIFLGRFAPTVFAHLSSSSFTYLPALLATLAAGPNALKNPHLRAKIPTLLYLLFIPHPSNSPSTPFPSLSYLFDTNESFRSSLMPALIDLYVEIEFGDRMFFPKFNVRYEITMILDHLYSISHYKQQLIVLSKDLDHFLRFVNAVANDLVYLFEEGLKCLTTLHSMQTQQATSEYQQLPAAQREEKEREYQQEEQHCTSYLQLASSTIHFLSVLTADVVEPFTTHRLDFVSRFATTLTYYINKLVGPSVNELKVKNQDRYHFQPRVLLKEMITIFLHLSSSTAFLEKVAMDERSYSEDIFNRAYSIIKRRDILDPPAIRLFFQKKNDIALIHSSQQNFLDSIGDIPEQYTDALIGSVMTDPVKLPKSQQVVDRVTIQRHLMNSATDPFNRSELKEEELVEMAELKAEIDAWMSTKKEEWLAGLKKQREEKGEKDEEDEEMKTDEGKGDDDVMTV